MKRHVSRILILPLMLHSVLGCTLHQAHARFVTIPGVTGCSDKTGHSGKAVNPSTCGSCPCHAGKFDDLSSKVRGEHQAPRARSKSPSCCVPIAFQQSAAAHHNGTCDGSCRHCLFLASSQRSELKDRCTFFALQGSRPMGVGTDGLTRPDHCPSGVDLQRCFSRYAWPRVHLLLGLFLI